MNRKKQQLDTPVLEVKNLTVNFADQKVIKNISFSLYPGEIIGIIGPNGSGKTTLLNSISGFHDAEGGNIFVEKEDITSMDSHRRARKYIGRSFQDVGVFKEMTLEENLVIVLESELKYPWWWMFSFKRKKEMASFVDKSLKSVGLFKYKKSLAGILSGGQLRLLELARLQLSSRSVLLIDEPTAGVAPVLRNNLSETIQKLSSHHGRSIILVEHDLKFLFTIVNRVIVLVDGKIYMDNTPEKVQKDKKLQDLYFGK